jgi:hypothetical protein
VALFELADLASFLQQDVDQATATLVRQRAEDYLRVELGVEFGQAERTWTGRVRATATTIVLPGPIASVASVTVDGTALGATDWEWTDKGVEAAYGFGYYATTDWVTVAVAYTGGLATVPSELEQWGIYLAALSYRQGPLTGVAQETVGGVFTTNHTEVVAGGGMVLPDHVLRSLRSKYGAGRRLVGTVALGW